MNILEFINSKNARRRLKKIEYTPDSLEVAWLIYQSETHTLDEKIASWEELIATMPDMPIPEGKESRAIPRLHKFLRLYIDKARGLAEDFVLSDGGAVFAYSVYCDDEWIRDENLYSSYEGVLRAANDDNDLSPTLFSIRKRFLDFPNNTWYAYLSPKREIMSIENSNCIMPDEDYTILYEVFQSLKFDNTHK